MKVYYISPSVIPSRSANSIHVVSMCEALAGLSYDVSFFVRSEELDAHACKEVIEGFYGVSNKKIEVVPYKSTRARGAELSIALHAFFRFIKDVLMGDSPQHIISRNLYAAVLLGLLLRNSVVYETHAPEKGVRKKLQKWLLSSNKIQTVVISEALRKVISDMHCVTNERIHVFHDAAREGQSCMTIEERLGAQDKFLGIEIDLRQYEKVVGYFGHLYAGRGIEIIQALALKNPNHAFIVYGGNEEDIFAFKKKNPSKNLYFMGHISPEKVREAMAMMNILLMPYQKSVSIGLDGIDTAQWMSPMKLFEYMSVGVPFIASDLPVLNEVLKDRHNCLFVEPADVRAWSGALQELINDEKLANTLAENAHNEYKEFYTWSKRSERMLALTCK